MSSKEIAAAIWSPFLVYHALVTWDLLEIHSGQTIHAKLQLLPCGPEPDQNADTSLAAFSARLQDLSSPEMGSALNQEIRQPLPGGALRLLGPFGIRSVSPPLSPQRDLKTSIWGVIF